MKEIRTFEELMDDEEVRKVMAIPRKVPRRYREDMAEILYRELFPGMSYDIKDVTRFIERYGAYYLLYSSFKSSEEWKKIKRIAGSSNTAAAIIFKIVISRVLDVVDDFPKYKPAPDEYAGKGPYSLLQDFEMALDDTLSLWDRSVSKDLPAMPGTGNEAQDFAGDLADRISSLQNRAGYPEFIGCLTREVLLSPIMDVIKQIEGHMEALELLSMLYPGRGWDYSMVQLHKTYLGDLHKYSKIVERNEDMRRMLELIGRIELEKCSRNAGLSSFSRSEVYSVTVSRDLQYLLPSELVLLEDETLKVLFFARLTEGRLLTYQLRGKEQSETSHTVRMKGPVIVLVDTSGSMRGSPEVVAKSIILAMVRQMVRDRRDVKVLMFSSIDQIAEIDLTGSNRMAQEFLDFLTYTFEGGTDFNTALKAGLRSLNDKKYRNADLLFITDGLSVISDEMLKEEWRHYKDQNGTRVFTIIVGNNTPGGLEELSDHTYILYKGNDWSLDNSPANVLRLISS